MFNQRLQGIRPRTYSNQRACKKTIRYQNINNKQKTAEQLAKIQVEAIERQQKHARDRISAKYKP